MLSARNTTFLLVAVSLAGLAGFVGCGADSELEPTAGDASDGSVDAASATPRADAAPDGTGSLDAHADADLDDCVQTTGGAPTELRCTGLYSDFAAKLMAPGVREYKPAVVLWSDGAVKRRWIALPAGSVIDSSNMDEWVFPIGTKFWKEFVLADKRIETRLLWKISEYVWVMTTYRWSDDGSTATRLDLGASDNDANAPDASGYEIPSVSQCRQCHAGSTDQILGFEAVGLGLAGATGVTLADLVAEGLLSVNPPTTQLAIPDDGHGSVAALGWMHANCGTSCHNANPTATCAFRGMHVQLGFAELQSGAAVSELDAYQTTYDVEAAIPGGGYQRIAPGNVANSAVHWLASHRDATNPNGQMPPIATHQIDTQGVASVAAWIDALP